MQAKDEDDDDDNEDDDDDDNHDDDHGVRLRLLYRQAERLKARL